MQSLPRLPKYFPPIFESEVLPVLNKIFALLFAQSGACTGLPFRAALALMHAEVNSRSGLYIIRGKITLPGMFQTLLLRGVD